MAEPIRKQWGMLVFCSRVARHLFVMVGLVATAELIAALYAPDSSSALSCPNAIPSDRTFFALPPGRRWAGQNPDTQTPIPISVNSWGHRDEERPATAPTGTTRILVLGGDPVFAPEVTTGELLTAQLQTLLHNRVGPTEVIDAGIPGHGPLLSAVHYQQTAHRLAPQVVLLVVTPQAEELDDAVQKFVLFDGAGTPLVATHPTSGTSGSPARWERLALVRYLRTCGCQFVARELLPSDTPASARATESLDALAAGDQTSVVTERAITALSRSVVTHGARFVLVMGTHPLEMASLRLTQNEQLAAARPEILRAFHFRERLRQLAARESLTLIDLASAMAEQPDPQSLFLKSSLTLNAAGHAAVAQLLADVWTQAVGAPSLSQLPPSRE